MAILRGRIQTRTRTMNRYIDLGARASAFLDWLDDAEEVKNKLQIVMRKKKNYIILL